MSPIGRLDSGWGGMSPFNAKEHEYGRNKRSIAGYERLYNFFRCGDTNMVYAVRSLYESLSLEAGYRRNK